MERLLAWFAQPSGKRFVSAVAVTTTCGIFSVQYFPQTFFLKNYYHDLVTMRKQGNPLAVTPKLESLVNEVVNDLDLSKIKRSGIQPFMVFGFDSWGAGYLTSRYGFLLGMPVNFTYEDKKSVAKESININNEPVNWNRDDAKKLIDSLILSDDAKKYAIAREILMADNMNVVIGAVTSSLIFGTCYGLTNHLNDSLGNWQKPRSVRVLFYGLMSLFFWGIYTMQKDGFTRHAETKVDQHLAQLGPGYIKGGYEFYEKMASRNIALRTLLGPKGDSLYTVNGNNVIWLRQKNLPVSHRKQFYGDMLKDSTIISTGNIQTA